MTTNNLPLNTQALISELLKENTKLLKENEFLKGDLTPNMKAKQKVLADHYVTGNSYDLKFNSNGGLMRIGIDDYQSELNNTYHFNSNGTLYQKNIYSIKESFCKKEGPDPDPHNDDWFETEYKIGEFDGLCRKISKKIWH